MARGGTVEADKWVREPQNLGHGWVGFDFTKAFGRRPVRIINAAPMQALASDKGKRMLLLGFGNRLMGPHLPAVWPQD